MDIQTATHDELMAYAKDVKGMKVSSKIGTETLRERLLGTPAPTGATQGSAGVTINIQATDEDGGGDDVFVGVNGRHFLMQRGVDVQVPSSVVHVLENAKKTLYRSVVDRQTGKRQLVQREVLSYPFQVIN